MHFLFFIHIFPSFAIKQNCQRGIKSSETAIRECLCKSKAFMRASVLTGLKWQQLFVKVTLFSASRYKACRTCLEDRHIFREGRLLPWLIKIYLPVPEDQSRGICDIFLGGIRTNGYIVFLRRADLLRPKCLERLR